jgi:hypothetical protein
MALALSIFVFGCEKKNAKTKGTEAVKSEATQNENIDRSGEQINDFQKKLLAIKLSQSDIDYVLEKMPAWTDVHLKHYEQIDSILKSADANDLSFVDKVDGLKADLDSGGIDPDRFFAQLEKTLHGYFFYNEAANIQNNKAEFDKQIAELEAKLNSPDTPEEQKAQLKNIIEGSQKEMTMLKGTPPGYSEEEYKLIELNMEKIQKILMEVQAKNQAQKAAEAA